jgi:transcriptional regulator with XRE-family HTH domain
MALTDQIRKYQTEQGLSLSELAQRSMILKGYPSQLKKNSLGPRLMSDIYTVSHTLSEFGILIGTLLE